MVNEISARTGLKESSSFMQEPMALSSVFLEESNKLRELFKQLSIVHIELNSVPLGSCGESINLATDGLI